MKFLVGQACTEALRPSVTRIEYSAQGALTLHDGNGFYPGTNGRVATLEAVDPQSMVAALRMVIGIAAETGTLLTENGRELRFTLVLPSKCVSALIGVGGVNIQAVQKASGAHIHVEGLALGPGPGGDRAVHIHGTAAALEKALEKVVILVEEFLDQPWFGKWAERTMEERLSALEAPPLPTQEFQMPPPPLDPPPQLGGAANGGAVGFPAPGSPMGNGMAALGGTPDPMTMMASMMGGMMNPMAMGMMAPMGMNPMAMMGAMNPMAMMNPMMGLMGMGAMMGAMPGLAGGTASPVLDSDAPGPEMVMQAIKELPPDVAADPRGFLLRCAMPGRLVGGLLGNGGAGAREVEEFTGTRISIPGDADEATRILSIEGPLLNVCAAYMLMMVRFINAEADLKGNLMGMC